jgi:DNA-directed RNA polymerase subunit H (RpoH/RPB5)
MTMKWNNTPLHEILSETQASRELRQAGIAYDRLPLIRYQDAALAALRTEGIETNTGSVVRITRDSKSAGEGFRYYRKITL